MSLAYYNPAVPITENAAAAQSLAAPSAAPSMSGDNLDMVVASDFSRRLYCYLNGQLAWERDYPNSYPRGLDVYNGLIFAANGTSIDILHSKIGSVPLKKIPAPNAPAPINSIRVTEWDNKIWVAVCFDLDGAGSVALYQLSGNTVCDYQLAYHSSNSHIASHPRGAIVILGWVFVADTFGHRVYAYDIASGGMRNSTEVYYPNSVDEITAANIMICAEHENRVFDWQYHPAPDVRTMIYSAPVAPYNNVSKTKSDIVVEEAATVDPSSTFTPAKSLCAIEGSGKNTLYSPNSARGYIGGTLIADTDNYRVIFVASNGAITTEVTGFNNPVNAVLL